MSERIRSMSDDELGVALATLDVEWAATPELAPGGHGACLLGTRIPRVVRLPLSRPKRIVLIAAATVLLLAGAAVAAKIIIDLGAVVVEVTPTRPGLLPTPFDRAHRRTDHPAGGRPPARRGRRSPTSALGGPDRVWADQRLHGCRARSRGSRWRGERDRTCRRSRALGTEPILDDLRGRRQPGLEGDLRGHRRAAVRDRRRRRLLLDHGARTCCSCSPARVSSTCAWRATCSCGATARTRCASRPPCPRPRPCGSSTSSGTP